MGNLWPGAHIGPDKLINPVLLNLKKAYQLYVSHTVNLFLAFLQCFLGDLNAELNTFGASPAKRFYQPGLKALEPGALFHSPSGCRVEAPAAASAVTDECCDGTFSLAEA